MLPKECRASPVDMVEIEEGTIEGAKSKTEEDEHLRIQAEQEGRQATQRSRK